MKESLVTLQIDSLEADGKGSGEFIDGAGNKKRAEVPFSMPGDVVDTLLKRKKGGVFPGSFLQLVQPAKTRVEPRCPHFGSCGGCSWQHISYEEQVGYKQAFIENFFRELIDDLSVLRPIIGAPSPWNYRNKMEFSFSQDREGHRFLGLMLAGRRGKVFNLHTCHLASPWFAESVGAVRHWWESTSLSAYNPVSNQGTLRNLTLRESKTTGEKMAILTVSGRADYAIRTRELKQFQALFDGSDTSLFLRIHQAIKGQPTEIYEMHLQGPETIRERLSVRLKSQDKASEIDFHISPAAFFQPNTLQAERLYIEALELAGLREEDVVYDLFCGTGTLGLLAARFVKSVIGIEISEEASLDGRENIKVNGLKNVEIVTGSVSEVLEGKRGFALPTLIFLDPPRAGLDPKSLEEVAALNCQRIVYISCNPKTQVRDVKAFLEKGYQLMAIQPIDQFPETPHIENIAYLVKS